MSVRLEGDRPVVEFQMCGKRIFRRLPKGFGLEDAEALEKKLRRDIFAEHDLGAISGDAKIKLTDIEEHYQWRLVANMMLHSTGVQPEPGIYFLCKEGALVYVGRSMNVASRLHGHRAKEYDYARMLPMEPAELKAVEAFLIDMLRPPMNVKGIGYGGRFLMGPLAGNDTSGHVLS